MKKTFLCIASVMTFGLVSQAQVTIIPKVGASLGNYAYSENDDDDETKANTGLTLGAGFNFALGETFSIQPELLYIQKGSKLVFGSASLSNRMNFLEIPVLGKVSFGSETVKAYVNAGPSLGYALGGRMTAKDDGETESVKIRFGDQESTDEVYYMSTEEFNRIDLGLQFGAGVGFQVGPGTLLLDARYGLGMSNFVKAQKETFGGVTISMPADGKSRTLAFTVGYAIPLGGN
jgi:opacity protein-like surface antigen